jgi:NAD(P)-dependent dehydrogenase (short-subunit alcohol dehydrogenase family)
MGAQDLDEQQAADWQETIASNLFSAVHVTNVVLPALKKSSAGAIVNISSGSDLPGAGILVHYGASKAALNYYSKALAKELGAAHKIRVNTVTPGARVAVEVREHEPVHLAQGGTQRRLPGGAEERSEDAKRCPTIGQDTKSSARISESEEHRPPLFVRKPERPVSDPAPQEGPIQRSAL